MGVKISKKKENRVTLKKKGENMDNKKQNKKIIIGSDHAGYSLKSKIISQLKTDGYNIKDEGAYSEDSIDYPDVAKKVSSKIAQQKKASRQNFLGILICGTGIGMSITANKFKGIRAALCHNKITAHMAREHNNANILCLGARIIDEKTAKECTKEFLSTDFSNEERHIKRVKKMDAL